MSRCRSVPVVRVRNASTVILVYRWVRRAPPGILLGLLVLVLLAPAVRAESLWGMEGIGRPENPYDHAARGAGSTGIAVDDPFGMSFVNPAAIAHARLPQYHVGVVMQDRWIESASGGPDRRMNVRLTMERLVLPWPGPVRWSFGYHDLTDGTYQVKVRANRGREDEYTRSLVGTGGIGELSSGVAALLAGGRVAAGLQFGFVNGRLLEVVEDRFSSPRYRGRSEMLTTRVRNGRAVGFGAQVVPHRGVSLGAVWRSSSSVDLISPEADSTSAYWVDRASFELPSEVGLGVAARRGRVRLAADWNHAAWGQGGIHTPAGRGSASAGSFRNTDRLGVGVTLFPPVTEAKGSLLRRTVWRAGFSWGQLPVRQRSVTPGGTGAGVTEWALTAGCGLPVKVDRGWLDLFLEAGRTGNLDEVRIRETFVRLGVGVTVGRFEKAF